MVPVHHLVSGANAFSLDPHFEATTRRDFEAMRAPVVYQWRSQQDKRVSSLAQKIFHLFNMPFHALYRLLHIGAAKIALLPSSSYPQSIVKRDRAHLLECTLAYHKHHDGWQQKRITVDVDGMQIDALIVGKPSTLSNKKWVLYSLGNGELYESLDPRVTDIYTLLNKTESNLLVFNYSGVGASTGRPDHTSIVKAYKAMLALLEDEEKGIGAKVIIGYGHSLGGAVQNEAISTHIGKRDIQYISIKSRTFSTFSEAANTFVPKLGGWLVKKLGWEIDSAAISKRLPIPEIIMQTHKHRFPGYLINAEALVESDGIIAKKAALATHLLAMPAPLRPNKRIIGVPEGHNEELSERSIEFIAARIKRFLLPIEELHTACAS